MPVFHIVLFRLRPGVSAAQLEEWSKLGKAMVGKIPGLLEFYANPPLAMTASRAKGYDMGVVAILEKPEHVQTYGAHPAHQEVHNIREQLCEDTLAYDMEY
ncbi:stress responsive A/B barrel domain protein [Aspergillus carlsbadensis]|nr:stress responsive A/B barrel domain protein [Aspergillus carlsbadensis]